MAALIVNDEHLTMIEDCEAHESRLTDWDRTFLDSIKAHLTDGGSLSEKQAAKLDEIWERLTSRG